mmetsp:Transcript_14157/g.31362  ORF Transcript_14157/g.31362 Transcript_14157/m.31362 type:complete len:200 (-) Transcript_14157:8-607(-)
MLGAALEGPEAAVAVRGQDQGPGEEHCWHDPRQEELGHVVARMRVVQGEDLRQRQQLPEATHLTCQELFTAAAAQLGEELQDGVEPQVPSFGEVEVLLVADVPAICAQTKVQTSEDVFAEVQRPRALRDSTLLHHVLFVHEIRMSVMHPGAQHRIAPLQQGAEGHLGARREVAHGAQVAGDVFWKANDLLGVPAELAQG